MPKLVYFVTEDWSFCQHFLPISRAARSAGLDVVVATRVRQHAERIAAEGCRVIALENERGSLGPLEAATAMFRMARIVRAERPDIVHCIGLRMALLGGIAAKLARARALVLAPTGLGHLWIANGIVERALRSVVRLIVGHVLRGRRTRYLFENAEDPREFDLDPAGENVTLIGGAGINPLEFPPTPEPTTPPVRVAVVSRMIVPKGIAESVAGTLRARELGAPVELHLYGAVDSSNRTAHREDELRAWAAMPGIFWHGPTGDVARVYREHHIAMLLSHREGLPRGLVEAAATGRAIVSTDVVGSREVVRDGVEGLLVPLDDVESVASALVRLAGDTALRARLGQAAHARFSDRFTEDAVMAIAQALYRDMLARAGR